MSRGSHTLMQGKHRPPIERMMQIHHKLAAGEYPNTVSLSVDLEVSSKTIQRDLDFMRDRMELPLEYDRTHNGYYYTQEVSAFPSLQITEGELVALLVAEKALQQYRGTSFEKPLVSAFKKLASQLPDTISFNMSEWEQTISFRTSAEPILNLQTFDALAKATARHRQIEFEYRKPGQKKTEPRVVDPYHLANINGEWFLFAYDHARKDIRTFVPARISALRENGRSFKRPEKFSLERRLHSSFGVVAGEKSHDVVIRFSAFAADFIREKRWHASQQLRELKDGGAELRMAISSLAEVQRWVLSWGGHATVIAPPDLKTMVHDAAEKLLKDH